MNINEFVEKYNNKNIDIDGAFGSQCYDLAAAWIIDQGWGNGFYCGFTGGVRDLAEHFDEISGIDRSMVRFEKNNPNDINQIPKAGDVIIFNLGQFGHIGVVVSSNINGFTCFEQNNGNGDGSGYDDRCTLVDRKYNNSIFGWVTPINEVKKEKSTSNMIIQDEKTNMINSLDIEGYIYPERRGVLKNAIDNNLWGYIVWELSNLAKDYVVKKKELEETKKKLEWSEKVTQEYAKKNKSLSSNKYYKLKSRKLWVTVLTGLFIALSDKLGINASKEDITALSTAVITYLISQGVVDAYKTKEKVSETGK